MLQLQLQLFTAPAFLSQPITCFNDKDGTVQLNITGGWAPYYLNITPTPTKPDPSFFSSPGIYNLTGLDQGTYYLDIHDFLGCTYPTQAITLDQPGFLTIIEPKYTEQKFMYKPYEIRYTYQGGGRDQLVNLILNGPYNLKYTLVSLQSTKTYNNVSQITIPHHIIPGHYTLYVGNNVCINEYSGEYVIHASQEALQRTNFP